MWTRGELKGKAKVAFKGNYWISVLAALVVSIFTAASSSSAKDSAEKIDFANINLGAFFTALGITATIVLVAAVIKVVVGYALTVGALKVFIMNETSSEKPGAGEIISVFKCGSLGNVVVTMLFKYIFTVLWTLLFIIPGIVKSYEYKMIPYILAENPAIDRSEAFAMSKQMMKGNKMKAFILDVSFIGWYIISGITCGIAHVLYVGPYIEQTFAELYLTLKEEA